MNDYMQYAKDLAKADKELGIKPYIYISFEYKNEKGERIRLHSIDIPRSFFDKWRWVIDWRHAKLVCQHPRENVKTYYSYYDKRSGLATGFGSLLSKLSSAKAQVTKIERAIDEYVEFNKQDNMFFDPITDEQLIKAKLKLMQKKKNVCKMQELLKEETASHKKIERSKQVWI